MQTLGTWLTDVDEAILEAFHESRFELSPSPLARNLSIEATSDHVGRRLRKLEDAGLVQQVDEDRGYYAITDLGDRVYEGELDRVEINELEPE